MEEEQSPHSLTRLKMDVKLESPDITPTLSHLTRAAKTLEEASRLVEVVLDPEDSEMLNLTHLVPSLEELLNDVDVLERYIEECQANLTVQRVSRSEVEEAARILECSIRTTTNQIRQAQALLRVTNDHLTDCDVSESDSDSD
jgi:transcriptional regulator of heat shock response